MAVSCFMRRIFFSQVCEKIQYKSLGVLDICDGWLELIGEQKRPFITASTTPSNLACWPAGLLGSGLVINSIISEPPPKQFYYTRAVMLLLAAVHTYGLPVWQGIPFFYDEVLLSCCHTYVAQKRYLVAGTSYTPCPCVLTLYRRMMRPHLSWFCSLFLGPKKVTRSNYERQHILYVHLTPSTHADRRGRFQKSDSRDQMPPSWRVVGTAVGSIHFFVRLQYDTDVSTAVELYAVPYPTTEFVKYCTWYVGKLLSPNRRE